MFIELWYWEPLKVIQRTLFKPVLGACGFVMNFEAKTKSIQNQMKELDVKREIFNSLEI